MWDTTSWLASQFLGLFLGVEFHDFEAMLAAEPLGCQCRSVSRSTTFVLTKIAQQLLDGLPRILVQVSMVPRGWWSSDFRWRHHEVHICSLEWNMSTTIGWISMKFDAHIHVLLRMNSNGDCFTFHIAPSSGENFDCQQHWFVIPA